MHGWDGSPVEKRGGKCSGSGKRQGSKQDLKVMERICNIAWYFAIMKKGEEAGDNKKGAGTRMKGYEKWEV